MAIQDKNSQGRRRQLKGKAANISDRGSDKTRLPVVNNNERIADPAAYKQWLESGNSPEQISERYNRALLNGNFLKITERPKYCDLSYNKFLDYLKKHIAAMDDTTHEARMLRMVEACTMNRLYWCYRRSTKTKGK